MGRKSSEERKDLAKASSDMMSHEVNFSQKERTKG